MSDLAAESGQERPRVLLLGDASVRPYGMERALSRAGFHLIEAAAPSERSTLASATPPDVALVTAGEADPALATLLQALNAAWGGQVPLVVILGSPDREGPARALALGADDVLALPVYLPELCARVEVRARRRGLGRPVSDGGAPDLLLDLLEEAQAGHGTAELLDTLVGRVGRVIPRWDAVFLAADEPAGFARIIAGGGGASARDIRLNLERYPEVSEALRTARPVTIGDIHTDPLFDNIRRRWAYERTEVRVRAVTALPLAVGERMLGVLLLRTSQPSARLTPTEEAFVGQIAHAAARILDAERRAPAAAEIVEPRTDSLTGLPDPTALDRRIQEESERARRYSLTFTLVLLDIDEQAGLNDRLGRATGDRLLTEMGRMLQREVRASDFVARYGGDEFALVLAETGSPGARELVHRIRQRLDAESFGGLPAGEQPRMSAGIVAYPHPAVQETSDLLVLLEAALRRGKAQIEERIGVAE